MFQELIELKNRVNNFENRIFNARVIVKHSDSVMSVIDESNLTLSVTMARSCTVIPAVGDLLVVCAIQDFGFFGIAVL